MIAYKTKKATRRRDSRGFLLDFLKRDELEKGDRTIGQIYLVTFEKKGVVRGNHFHKTKKEWFVAVRGKLKVVLESVKNKERIEFVLNGDSDDYERVQVDKNIAHAFTSLSDEAILINYCNKPYHFDNPDTHKYILI